MEWWRTCLVLVLCGACVTLAAPADERCASKCLPVHNPKFKYDAKKVYTYNYESESKITGDGLVTEQPGFKVTAIVEFHVLTPCEFGLKLKNVKLESRRPVPQANNFKQALESKNLYFSFTDGRIDHICPDAKDPVWVVNFKRAILSAFQNSADNNLESHVREADVLGLCDTHYTVTGSGKTQTYEKTKNLLSCTHRQGNITSLQADHYFSASEIQSYPAVKSTHHCTHSFANNIIQSLVCEETHKDVTEEKVGSKLSVKLTYSKSGKSTFPASRGLEHTTLFFDQTEEEIVKGDPAETEKVLNEVCAKSADGSIPGDAAERFTSLVHLVRRLSEKDIRSLLAKAEACSSPKAKDTFLGSLVSAGTESALKVLVEILKKNELSKLRSRLWLSSLAFIARPTLGAIDAVTPLISEPNPTPTALLSVSALVHGYCRQHTDCEKDKQVLKVLDTLGRAIGSKCKAKTEAEEDKLIAILKAFGNVGRVGKYENVILECAKDKSLDTAVRLAAVEAFRRAPYDDQIVEVFFNLLENEAEDTEVRIDSYQGLIKHANPNILARIDGFLKKVVNVQVSSYIWSHLRNILETKAPQKQHLKALVQKAGLDKHEYKNPLKYSQNYETSVFWDKYNLGGNVDANVIYTPESFLPRSATVNVSLDMFGSSFNILEVDARIKNLEPHLEALFGPNGELRQKSPQELALKFRERWRGIAEDIEKEATDHDHTKHKRELPYSSSKIQEVHSRSPRKAEANLEGSVSIKVFGNELRWVDFHKLDDIYDKEDPYHLQDFFNKLAKHKELDVARNWVFIDSTFYIPTITGLPLKYDLNATLSVGLKLNSHFDIRGLLTPPRHADIQSFIQPSISLQSSGALLLDAYVAKVGLKGKANFHSSTAENYTVQIQSGRLYEVKLDFPQKEVELYHYQAGLYTVFNDREEPATPVNADRYNIKECSQRLNLGMQLCNTISLPKPAFSLDGTPAYLRGPVEYQLLLKKVEEGLQGYHFIAKFDQDKEADGSVFNTEFKVSFNTPGSTVDREYTIDYQWNRNANTLKAHFRTPARKLELNGNYAETGNTKEGTLTLDVNKERRYTLTGKSTVKKQGNTETYTPTWEFTRPDGTKTVITGTVVRTVGKKIVIDLASTPSSDRKVLIKGYAERDGPLDQSDDFKGSTDIHIVLPYIDTTFKGALEHHHSDKDGEKHHLDADLEYTLLPEGVKRGGSLKFEDEQFVDRKTHDFKIKRSSEFKLLRFPEYNYNTRAVVEKNGNQYHVLVDNKWGDDFKDPNRQLFFESNHKLNPTKRSGLQTEGKVKFVYPRYGITWDITSKGQFQPSELISYELEAKYAPNKVLKVETKFVNETTRLRKYRFELEINHPDREIEFDSEFEETAPKSYKGKIHAQWQKGEFADITYVLKDKSGGSVVLHKEAEVLVYLNGQKKPFRKYVLLVHREPEVKTALLFKVERPDVTYLIDIQHDHPTPDSGNFKLDLKTPWIEGQVATKRIPHSFDGNFDFKTDKRRVIGTTKLTGDANKKLNAVLKWDAGHDDTQKLVLNADIVRPRKRALSLKGTLETPKRTVKAELKYDLPLTLFNGVHAGYLNLEYAPGKTIILDGKVNVDKTLHDRRLSNGEFKISGTAFHEVKVAYSTDYHKLPDQRSFKTQIHVEDSVHGNAIVALDYLLGANKVSSDVEVTYGDGKKVGVGLGLFYDVDSGQGFDVGGSFKLQTPVQQFGITIREGFKRSPEYTHIIHDNHVKWGKDSELGAALEWSRKYDPEKGFEILGRLQFETPLEHLKKQKLQVGLSLHHDVPHFGAEVEAIWGAVRKFKSIVLYRRVGSRIDVHLLYDARSIGPTSFVEVVYNRVPSGDDRYTSSGSVTYQDKKYTFANSGFWTPDKKTVDATINVPGNATPFTLKGSLTAQGTKRNLDLVLTTNSEKVTVTGDFVVDKNSQKGKVIITAGPNRKFVIDIDHKLDGAKRSYDWKFNLGPQYQFDLLSTVADKPNDLGHKFDNIFKVNGENFATSAVDIVHKPTDKSIFGKTLSWTASVKNDLLSFNSEGVFLTETGLNPSIRVCTADNSKCIYTDILLDLHRWHKVAGGEAHDVENKVHAKFGAQRAPGDSRTIGFIYKSTLKPSSFERTVKWALHEEENKFIGYHYKKEKSDKGKTKVYQILLPSRTFEAKREIAFTSKGFLSKIHLKLDAVRKPNDELLLTTDFKNRTDGWDAVVTVKHPKLANDITFISTAKLNEGKIFTHKAELRFSNDPKKAFIILSQAKKEPLAKYPKVDNVTLSTTIQQSPIKNFDFSVSSYIADGDALRSVGRQFYWLTKAGLPKLYSFTNTFDKILHTINGALRTPYREFTWEGAYRKLDDGGFPAINSQVDLSYNGKLFRRGSLEYSRGPEYNLKYFVDPADTKRLFRLHGGVADDDTYHWTASRVRDGKTTEDVDLLVKRNNSYLLFVKLDWRPDLWKDLKAGIEARNDKIGDDVEKALKTFFANFREEVREKAKDIKEALEPKLKPLTTEIREKLTAAVEELQNDIKATDFQRLKVALVALTEAVVDTEDFVKALDSHDKYLEPIIKFLDRVKAFLNRDSQDLEVLSAAFETIFEELPYKIEEFRAKLKTRLPEIADKIQETLYRWQDIINDIKEKQPVTKALQKLQERYAAFADNLGDGSFTSLYEKIKAKLWEYAEGDGQFADALKKILTFIKSVKEKVQEQCQKLKKGWEEYREKSLRELSGLYHQLQQNEDFKALTEEAKKYREHLESQRHALEENIRKQAPALFVDYLQKIRDRLRDLADDVVVDFRNGHIRVYVPLLVPVESLRHAREHLDIRELLFRRREGFSLLDVFYEINPYFAGKKH